MEFIKNIDIWPGKNNGVLVEKTDSNGKPYEARLSKEEYALEEFLLGVEQEGISDLDQVEELRRLIEDYGSHCYQNGANNQEIVMNDC
jgi:hypothetical protein